MEVAILGVRPSYATPSEHPVNAPVTS